MTGLDLLPLALFETPLVARAESSVRPRCGRPCPRELPGPRYEDLTTQLAAQRQQEQQRQRKHLKRRRAAEASSESEGEEESSAWAAPDAAAAPRGALRRHASGTLGRWRPELEVTACVEKLMQRVERSTAAEAMKARQAERAGAAQAKAKARSAGHVKACLESLITKVERAATKGERAKGAPRASKKVTKDGLRPANGTEAACEGAGSSSAPVVGVERPCGAVLQPGWWPGRAVPAVEGRQPPGRRSLVTVVAVPILRALPGLVVTHAVPLFLHTNWRRGDGVGGEGGDRIHA